MSNEKIPTWITVFGWSLGIFGISMGLACYLAPGLVVDGIDAGSTAGMHAMGSLGGRNLAMGVTLIVALLSKSPSLLKLAFIMRLVTEVTDLYISAKSEIYLSAFGIPTAAIVVFWLLCLILPEILAIKKLQSIDS